MKQLFCAVGVVEVEFMSAYGIVRNKTNFTHVVEADSSHEAEQKVQAYYKQKNGEEYTGDKLSVIDLEIFDFIK